MYFGDTTSWLTPPPSYQKLSVQTRTMEKWTGQRAAVGTEKMQGRLEECVKSDTIQSRGAPSNDNGSVLLNDSRVSSVLRRLLAPKARTWQDKIEQRSRQSKRSHERRIDIPLSKYEKWDFKNITNIQPVGQPWELVEEDMVIVIMGQTGTGKSTFIRTIIAQWSGRYDRHDEDKKQLDAVTNVVTAVRISFHDKSNASLVLLDTPGLDATESHSDGMALERIGNWVQIAEMNYSNMAKVSGKRRVSGILYMHRITDNRMAGSAETISRIFRRLCGEDFHQRVVLVTTMWPSEEDATADPDEARDCETHEQDLNKFWSSLIRHGSKIHRFNKTAEKAIDIVNAVVNAENTGV
ncbi:hypothetical protein NP233_g11970 [Leucocoprinus birnbaumii]|uniref:G domain-containing protein n=1 Tax=Leucocoprinus birnbaumii TaxID=56174 RepID=A0AAD5VL73_9AGAR|nr:hypothetical protein NP233_g11970 [Leucocoprinus birnbaumii]